MQFMQKKDFGMQFVCSENYVQVGITVDNHIVIKFSIFFYVIYDNDIK